MDQLIKKAIGLAEKEAEEKEVERIKIIVKSYLEKINEKSKEKARIENEIKILKKDLDDLKSGRLDKIEERQEKDPRAKEVSIIIVNKIEKEYRPVQPWFSRYEVVWNSTPFWVNYSTSGTSYQLCNLNSTTGLSGACGGSYMASPTGKLFQNFTGGTYKLDCGDIINL